MAETIRQTHIAMLREKIEFGPAAIQERAEACDTLISLYPSQDNKALVKRMIKRWLAKNHSPNSPRGRIIRKLREKFYAEEIRKHVERLAANRERKKAAAVPPAGTVAKAPDANGDWFFIDRDNRILGPAPKPVEKPTPVEKPKIDFSFTD